MRRAARRGAPRREIPNPNAAGCVRSRSAAMTTRDAARLPITPRTSDPVTRTAATWARFVLALAGAVLPLTLAGCGPAPTGSDPVLGGHPALFARGGIALDAGADARVRLARADAPIADVPCLPLAPGCVLADTPWSPGERFRVLIADAHGERALDLVAPPHPSPLPLAVIDLEPILPPPTGTVAGGHVTVCRLSPDGRRVLLATLAGRIAVLDLPSGKLAFGSRLCDGMVKQAAWAPDGRSLWIGEQTRDGFLRRLDADSGAEAFRFRLADELGEGPAPDPDNPYAWVNQPGPYRMVMLPGGDLVVAGERSGTSDGKTASASRVYRIARDGTVRWRWPAEAPIALNVPWFDVDAAGKQLAFVVAAPLGAAGGSAGPVAPGSVGWLDLERGVLAASYVLPRLGDEPPHFWHSVAMSPDGTRAAVTTQDGREFLFAAPAGGEWKPLRESRIAAPIHVSGLPVHVTSGTVAATADEAIFVLGDTYIPFGARRGEERPLSAHPSANTLHAIDWSGGFRWRWPMENFPNAIVLDGARRWAAVAFSPGESGLGSDRNGLAVFDLARRGAALDRVAWEYLTAGAIPYEQFDISADGRRIVLVETPYAREGGAVVRGRFRLHVIH